MVSVLVRATLAQQFVDLCCVGDLEDVRAAVQNGVDVNMKAEDGRTGLITVLMYKQSEVASFLLGTEGVDVDVVPRGGGTALHEASRHEANSECLAKILARPDLTTGVNQADWDGLTPSVAGGDASS